MIKIYKLFYFNMRLQLITTLWRVGMVKRHVKIRITRRKKTPEMVLIPHAATLECILNHCTPHAPEPQTNQALKAESPTTPFY